jgi:hypothetical protein
MLDEKTKALLGDKEAQRRFTERGEMLPCSHGNKTFMFSTEECWHVKMYRIISKNGCCYQYKFYETPEEAIKDWNDRKPILTSEQIDLLDNKKCCRTCEFSNGNEYGTDDPVDYLVCRFNDGAELFVQPDDYCSYGYKERLSER